MRHTRVHDVTVTILVDGFEDVLEKAPSVFQSLRAMSKKLAKTAKCGLRTVIYFLQAFLQAIGIQSAFISGVKPLPELLYSCFSCILIFAFHDREQARIAMMCA